MRFVNHTPLPAAMIPSCEGDDRVTALFLCAITYRLGERGLLGLAKEQRPLLLGNDLPYPSDAMFRKDAVSVCATGFVYPREREGRQATAVLRVGRSEAAIAAFGPRVWERGLSGALTPSRPLPFERVAMTWQNAYGGVVDEPAAILRVDGEDAFLPAHESAYPLSFDGIGFYTSAAHALHQPLPQLEHPEQLVRSWDDRPEPVCFAPCPLWSGLRAAFVMRQGQIDLPSVKRMPSRAAPRTTFDRIEPGTEIALLGMRPGGRPLQFLAPPPPAFVDLTVGAAVERAVSKIDAIDIDAEASEVRVLYRASVTYGLVQFEVRTARLEPTSDFPEA